MNALSAGQVRLQVHTHAVPEATLAALREECESLATALICALGVRFEEGEDEGKYLNIVFGSHTPQDLWPHLKAALYQSSVHGKVLQASSMALRTGEDGWNDYALLYHFDPSVPVEQAQ
jgi:hypothetical protein